MNEYQLQQLKEQRQEIRQLLALFERAAFRPDDGNNGGDPTAALNAIHETRVALGMKGAAFLADAAAASFFKTLQDGLLNIEHEVQRQYPEVAELAAEWRGQPLNTRQRIQTLRAALGETYQQAAYFIRAKAFEVYDSPEKARPILAALDQKIQQLLEQPTAPSTTVVVIDQSQHYTQSGGVNLHSEGDTTIGGSVVGRDDIDSQTA